MIFPSRILMRASALLILASQIVTEEISPGDLSIANHDGCVTFCGLFIASLVVIRSSRAGHITDGLRTRPTSDLMPVAFNR
jgi:hypothetical protein